MTLIMNNPWAQNILVFAESPLLTEIFENWNYYFDLGLSIN